jgi:Lambda phage tail tube protein, TTP
MSDQALEAQGMALYIDTGAVSPTSWSIIPDTKNIAFRTGSAAVIDVTDLSSTAKEKRMGLADEGQCTFTLMFRPKQATHAELVQAKADRQSRDFKLVLTDTPSPTTYYFTAYCLSVPVTGNVDAVIESNVTLEITGPVTQ